MCAEKVHRKTFPANASVMPLPQAIKSDSSCESWLGTVPAVTPKKIPEVQQKVVPEKNSEEAELTDAFRQREIVRLWVADIQLELLKMGPPSLAQLTVMRSNLGNAYRKYNQLHGKVIALLPDEAMDEQAEVYRKFEAIIDCVATSVEEMLLDIPQHASTGSMPESVSKTLSTSLNQCRDVVHQATKPFETRSDPVACRVSPENSRDVAECTSPEPLLPAVVKFCDSLPSGVTSHRRDTKSDASNERKRKHSVEPAKQDPVGHRVSAGIHKNVAASASLQPLMPSISQSNETPNLHTDRNPVRVLGNIPR